MVSTLFTDKLPNGTKMHCVKYLKESVCFNHCSITEFTLNQLSKIANTECLI